MNKEGDYDVKVTTELLKRLLTILISLLHKKTCVCILILVYVFNSIVIEKKREMRFYAKAHF